MPNPKRNCRGVRCRASRRPASRSRFHSAPWRPDYLGSVQSGKAELYLLGWTGDFGDPANFLNVHFGAPNDQFGFNNPALFNLLTRADSETNLAKRAALYQQASHQVMKYLPMVPYVHAPAHRVPEAGHGLHPEPRLAEPSRAGLLRVGPRRYA